MRRVLCVAYYHIVSSRLPLLQINRMRTLWNRQHLHLSAASGLEPQIGRMSASGPAPSSERLGQMTSLSAHRTFHVPDDAALYRNRHRVENMFARLKDWRRIATRCDRCPELYLSAIALAATAMFWL
jgi:hypothetical protein